MRFLSSLVVLSLLALAACATPPPQPRQYIVFFPTDDAVLTADGQQVVAQIAGTARDYHPVHVIVTGQADGGTPHDALVADRRGAAVVAALAAAGIDPKTITQVAGAPQSSETGVVAHKVVVRLTAEALGK